MIIDGIFVFSFGHFHFDFLLIRVGFVVQQVQFAAQSILVFGHGQRVSDDRTQLAMIDDVFTRQLQMFVFTEGRLDFGEIVFRVLKKRGQKLQHATSTIWIVLVRRGRDRRFGSIVDGGRLVTINGDEISEQFRSSIENGRGL